MKALVAATALVFALSTSVMTAQDRPAAPPQPESSAPSNNAPQAAQTGKSNATTGSAQSDRPSNSTAGQPEVATGADLKGPPQRFPANNTPE